MRRGWMRRLLGVVAVGTALVAGACGSDGDDSARSTSTNKAKERPTQVVLAAADKTAEAKSSRMTFTLLMQGMQGVQGVPGGNVTVTGDGAFDYANRQGAFTLNLPSFGGMQVGQIEAVSTGTTVYEKFPPQLASLLGGKPWVKFDLNQLAQGTGVDFNSISQASSGDPTQTLQYLKGAGDMVEVGREQLRGETVTHYRGTFDMAKAAATAPPEQQPSLQKMAQIYGSQQIPVDVWVDGEQRLRKLSYVVDLGRLNLPAESTGGQRPTGTFTFTLDLFDFGTPVTVTVPPPDQVTDLAQLLARSGR